MPWKVQGLPCASRSSRRPASRSQIERSVGADHAVADHPRLAGPPRVRRRLGDAFAIVRMDHLEPDLGLMEPMLDRVVDELRGLRADVRDMDGGVGLLGVGQLVGVRHDRAAFRERPVAVLRGGRLGFGVHATRDIQHHALEGSRVTGVGSRDQRSVVQDPDDAPVLREVPVLHDEGLAGPHAPVDGLGDARLIVRVDAGRRVPLLG